MPRLTDPAAIRDVLQTDRIWSVYALGDLLPGLFAKTVWLTPDLTLVLRDYGTSILFAMGEGSVAAALDHVTWPVHLQVQAGAMAVLDRLTVIEKKLSMWRMGWSGDRSGWVDVSRARRLQACDVPSLSRLYADGALTGESPDFFFPSMVEDGVFYGVYEGEEIVAAAGTHLYAPSEGAVAIGNVYTRRDMRGRGLGTVVTCATLAAVAEVETVGLNVRAENAAAIRVYEALGFRKHCPFFEALAIRPR